MNSVSEEAHLRRLLVRREPLVGVPDRLLRAAHILRSVASNSSRLRTQRQLQYRLEASAVNRSTQ